MEIEILHEHQLLHWCERIDIPPEAVAALVDIARAVTADPILLQIFSAFYEKTSLRGEWQRDWADLPFHPYVLQQLQQRASLFYLLAYLAALPGLEQLYLRRAIPMSIFKDTLSDFSIWMEQYYLAHGHWGFSQFMWIWRHLVGELFCLGRLQYMLAPFRGGVTAFRSKADGQVLLLADPQLPLRADGFALAAGLPEGQHSEAVLAGTPVWLPVFQADASGWRGHPVSPYGFALKSETFLPASQWDLILQHGDTVLDIHIPRPGAFNLAVCRDSLQQALPFFAGQVLASPIRALFCHTWFFTPQLQQMLPPESSIVRFQREFYLYPYPGSPSFLWSFVFGDAVRDPRTAPRDTSLRRAVLDWLNHGGELFELAGVMFHSPQDWGSQVYMRSWDARPQKD